MAPALDAGNLASFNLWHPKSSSPQMPWEDMQIISAIFARSVISEGFGKIAAIFAYRLNIF